MMGRSGIFRRGAACLMAVCLFSCSRPVSEEYFVRTDRTDAWGRYVFDVDLDDPACSYALDVLVSMDCNNLAFKSFKGLTLGMLWESPAGQPYEESIPVGPEASTDASFFYKYLKAPYRTDLRPAEYGRWKLYVSIWGEPEYVRKVSGVGLALKRNQAGTRQAEEI